MRDGGGVVGEYLEHFKWQIKKKLFLYCSFQRPRVWHADCACWWQRPVRCVQCHQGCSPNLSVPEQTCPHRGHDLQVCSCLCVCVCVSVAVSTLTHSCSGVGIAQFVKHLTEKLGAVLMWVWTACVARDFPPRVSLPCRPTYNVHTALRYNCMHQLLCTCQKSQTLATMLDTWKSDTRWY